MKFKVGDKVVVPSSSIYRDRAYTVKEVFNFQVTLKGVKHPFHEGYLLFEEQELEFASVYFSPLGKALS
jgi:hypothetical protein